MIKTKEFLLYKIYYSKGAGGDELVYIGRTNQSLDSRLHGHFFKAPMMPALDINQVSRIECATVQTAADLYAMEVILINRYKPIFNCESKTGDQLTINFPHISFSNYECPHLEHWRQEISIQNRNREIVQNRKTALLHEHRKKRLEIFSNKELTADAKSKLWTKWLVEYYEPAMEAINCKEETVVWQGKKSRRKG